eukprot:5052138-Pleurochrysis_carterae.AAC.1
MPWQHWSGDAPTLLCPRGASLQPPDPHISSRSGYCLFLGNLLCRLTATRKSQAKVAAASEIFH